MLKKLNQECVFSINNRRIKQTDGCPIGDPIPGGNAVDEGRCSYNSKPNIL